jgi:hypothetical protein
MRDESALLKAVDEAMKWVPAGGWCRVIIERNNECSVAA